MAKDAQTLPLLEVAEGTRERYEQQSRAAGLSFVLTALSLGNDCETQLRTSRNKRLQLEMCLVRMAHIFAAVRLASAGAISFEAI